MESDLSFLLPSESLLGSCQAPQGVLATRASHIHSRALRAPAGCPSLQHGLVLPSRHQAPRGTMFQTYHLPSPKPECLHHTVQMTTEGPTTTPACQGHLVPVVMCIFPMTRSDTTEYVMTVPVAECGSRCSFHPGMGNCLLPMPLQGGL